MGGGDGQRPDALILYAKQKQKQLLSSIARESGVRYLHVDVKTGIGMAN
jgi:hypothetical protein